MDETNGATHARRAVIFLGPPGAGKGTQAKLVASRRGLEHLSTGDMFRENVSLGTELGARAKPYMMRGDLVPDEIVLGMLERRVVESNSSGGFVLDGFPRTLPQAEALSRILAEQGYGKPAVIHFVVDRPSLLRRLSGRRMCGRCGRIYHVYDRPPGVAGVCDDDGGALTQRQDDREEVVTERLLIYDRETEPLVQYYKTRGALWELDAGADVEAVTRAVLAILNGKR
jgi:adenylate kinase